MQLCEYGCGQEAKYQFKNGKWCCNKRHNSCSMVRKKVSIKIKELHNDSKSKYNSNLYKEKQSNIMKEIRKNPNYKHTKLTIEQINERYPFFSKIEEMRYNPDKPREKEIQVHCKNHNCKNSKEKSRWFSPTYNQLSYRIGALENPRGFGESNFYCSQYCKDTCFLYNIHNDPLQDNNLPYTYQEIQIYNNIVLDRENGLCEYCGESANIVHHIQPKKLEPFFALDSDFGIAVCKKCHYKYGHQDECNTGNLAKVVCSVESQKFLNQKI